MASYFEQDEEFDDRRKVGRWNLPIPVRVKGSLAGGEAFEEETITTDASPSGMCVLISKDVRVKDTLTIAAPEEKFEAAATVVNVNPLGANMNRVRVAFTPPARFSRDAATKKYIYDFVSGNWVGYMLDGVYYNSKHDPFGRVKGSTILRLGSDQILFLLKSERAYDMRGNCIGHII